jgi:hypothetical protein
MNWGTVKKTDVKKSTDKIVDLRPAGSEPSFDNPQGGNSQIASAKERGEDLESGMELLELDFLLGVIENTDGDDKNDVTMRKLAFNEITRRQQQNEIDSFALKVYAINDNNLYGKDIQCEAMKELSLRTEQHAKRPA